jgi:hypothetical protein
MCKIKKIFIGLIIMMLFSGCPYDPEWELDGGIIIENNSNETIIYGCLMSRDLKDIEKNYWGGQYGKYTVFPNSLAKYEFNIAREKAADFERLPRRYYLFNLDSVKTIPWERIRDEQIILKKVIFNSWEEMEACNFTITYP